MDNQTLNEQETKDKLVSWGNWNRHADINFFRPLYFPVESVESKMQNGGPGGGGNGLTYIPLDVDMVNQAITKVSLANRQYAKILICKYIYRWSYSRIGREIGISRNVIPMLLECAIVFVAERIAFD